MRSKKISKQLKASSKQAKVFLNPVKKIKKQPRNSSKRSKRPASKKKIILGRHPLMALIIGLSFFIVLLFYFIPKGSTRISSLSYLENAEVIIKQEQPQIGLPKRLKIPSIKVNATVDSVGLTPAGAVGVPKGPYTVAWFNPGPRPGENGSAIITGHYGPWVDGRKSVFDNLNKLKIGDKLSVIDDKGITINFVVRAIKKYDMKSDASEVFISMDGKAHLNLITCMGTWNKRTKQYSNRLVVFTDKE